MLCRHARKRLALHQWRRSECAEDQALMKHLRNCADCRLLVQAEENLIDDLATVSNIEPPYDLPLEVVRSVALKAAAAETRPGVLWSIWERASGSLPRVRYLVAVGSVALVFLIAALVPFNVRQVVGYQVAIAGVEKSIAEENPKITSLLSALGMERDKASTLLDTLETNEIRLSVGECRETCRLTISDLKTEQDARVVVEAILKLGCCQIDDIAPIFRNESTSLLRLAARKLLS